MKRNVCKCIKPSSHPAFSWSRNVLWYVTVRICNHRFLVDNDTLHVLNTLNTAIFFQKTKLLRMAILLEIKLHNTKNMWFWNRHSYSFALFWWGKMSSIWYLDVQMFQGSGNWFGKKCKKVNHSASALSFLVPSFLSFSFSEGENRTHYIFLWSSKLTLFVHSEKDTLRELEQEWNAQFILSSILIIILMQIPSYNWQLITPEIFYIVGRKEELFRYGVILWRKRNYKSAMYKDMYVYLVSLSL